MELLLALLRSMHRRAGRALMSALGFRVLGRLGFRVFRVGVFRGFGFRVLEV